MTPSKAHPKPAPRPEVDEGAEAAAREGVQPVSQPAPGVDPTEATANPFGASVSVQEAPVGDGGPEADAEFQARQDEANAVEAAEPGSAPGPATIPGAFGTTVDPTDPTDPTLGKLRVEVRSNVSVDNEVLTPFRKVEVTDTPETRSIIAVGHLRLLEDDEDLDSE